MLQDYIHAAIRHANYEILPEDGSIYCEIPECQGVYAKAQTVEEARNEIIETLEDWLFIRLRKNLEIPVINNINLNVMELAYASFSS